MPHTLTLRRKEPLTHDTVRLVFGRPAKFDFKPGQATTIALDRDGWRDEERPFTMTSQPEDTTLEFVIKIYPDHHGVTEQIGTLKAGEKVRITDPEGAITYQGPGTFIAGGTGVTPFIGILRHHACEKDTSGCHLVFSNKSERDIILRDEWEEMAGLRTTFVLTEESTAKLPKTRIDRSFLEETVDLSSRFYICGPEGMVDDVRAALTDLGVDRAQIVTEEGW